MEDATDYPNLRAAQRLRELPTSEFGSARVFLWRCRVCEGFFIEAEPILQSRAVMVVGLIPLRDNSIERAETRREVEDAARQVTDMPCRCDRSPASGSP